MKKPQDPKLVALMAAKGMTARDIGNKAGIHAATIWRISTGASIPSTQVADAIALALGVDRADLFPITSKHTRRTLRTIAAEVAQ
jgi:transcriptional regulator with XRE-family HTH domain